MADILTRQALAHLDEPMRQIVYALERARDANEAEATRRLDALDYSAEFFAEDAESLQQAIDWICAARAERGMRRKRLAVITDNWRRPRPRPDLHLQGSDYHLSTPATRERLEAENPRIPTRDWRNALLQVVNEANHHLMAKKPDPTHLLEAIRRATLLLDRDARTVPTLRTKASASTPVVSMQRNSTRPKE
jgi:thioesterase domain-containing protein